MTGPARRSASRGVCSSASETGHTRAGSTLFTPLALASVTRNVSEEHFEGLVLPDHAHELVDRDVHQNQDGQDDLDGQKVRPYDPGTQLLVAGDEAAGLPPEVDELFQI